MSHTRVRTNTTRRRGGRGQDTFNIHQPVVGVHERVATRSEALRRIQDEYNEKLIEHEAKERAKEAKKREERLAKYKHVDQGHRLSEGQFNGAAGFDPDVAQFLQSEEEIRQRQQEQLKRDALIYEESKRYEDEQKKKREEEKQRQRLEKLPNVNAGYRLGGGDFSGTAGGAVPKLRNPLANTTNGCTEEKKRDPISEVPKNREVAPCAESYIDEVRQRQQEQLRQDALINKIKTQEISKQEEKKQNKPMANNQNVNAGYRLGRDEFAGPAGGAIPKARNHSANAGNPRKAERQKEKESDVFAEVQRAVPREVYKTSSEAVPKLNQTRPDLRSEGSHHEEMKHQLLSQLEGLMAKPSKTPKTSQPPGPSEKLTQEEPPKTTKPASVVVKKPSQEPVLVLRSSEKALQSALAYRFQVQDEMDKHGDSANYTPQVEPAPMYSNNRFESKSAAVLAETSGTIPTPVATLKLPPKNAAPVNDLVKPEAVLVRQSSEKALQSALAYRFQVQDEMDKHGESACYTPQVEPAPIYSSNRFEKKSAAELDKTTGTISTPLATLKPPPNASPVNDLVKPEEDFQAEMRAARLRMQQKYDEFVKKQEVNS